MTADQGEVVFTPIRGVRILPDMQGPVPIADLVNDWLQDRSNLLIISGAPGVGKSSALRWIEQLGAGVECYDDFPPPDGTFGDVSRLLQGALDKNNAARVAVATEIRISDRRTGARTLAMLWVQNPWAVTLQPLLVPEVEALIQELGPTRDVARLRALVDLDERGHDTHFLRTREALDILLKLPPSDRSAETITQLVNEFVMTRLYRGSDQQMLNPNAHMDLLSSVCYDHFLGLAEGDPNGLDEALANEQREGEVSLEWLSEQLRRWIVKPTEDVDGRAFVQESPFLTLQLEPSPHSDSDLARVGLPDALVYEYFVARGMLAKLWRGEDVKLSLTSLRQLSDGMVVLFLQSQIGPDQLDSLERQCLGGLANHERLLVLFLLEDEESFVALLREAGPTYHAWLKDFKDNAPNTFCWKMAAYQLLALGHMPLEEYLREIEREPEDERAYEFTAQAARGAGDIEKQLISRLRKPELRNCRGVTAIRMGLYGSLDCVLPLADALADSQDPFERAIIRRELANLLVRHKP